jgi:hypothetical protein
MKPCRNFRKSIALLAADALAHGEASAIRQHLAQCPACREYFRAMQAVCADHRQAGLSFTESHPLPEPHLLLRVSEQLVPGEKPSASIRPTHPAWFWLPRLAWPLAIFAIAAIFWRQIDPKKATEPNPTPLPTIAAEHNDPTSTHMAYRLALNHSFEQLDRALAKSADETAPPPAQSLYRSRLELADGGF